MIIKYPRRLFGEPNEYISGSASLYAYFGAAFCVLRTSALHERDEERMGACQESEILLCVDGMRAERLLFNNICFEKRQFFQVALKNEKSKVRRAALQVWFSNAYVCDLIATTDIWCVKGPEILLTPYNTKFPNRGSHASWRYVLTLLSSKLIHL
jgi:hypothetical protein